MKEFEKGHSFKELQLDFNRAVLIMLDRIQTSLHYHLDDTYDERIRKMAMITDVLENVRGILSVMHRDKVVEE